jgi:hypothetical protein
MAREINGLALGSVLAGSVFIYSALKGVSVLSAVRAVVSGQSPTTLPNVNPIGGGGSDSGTTGSGTGSDGTSIPSVTGSIPKAIAVALRGAGANNYAVAGALGNIQVESGFSATVVNAREGAIGLVQWEGNRRTNLQNFARSHGDGGKETDPAIQIAFMLSEHPPIGEMNASGSAAAAAAIWDSQYEGSAGTSRGARVSAANAWYIRAQAGQV